MAHLKKKGRRRKVVKVTKTRALVFAQLVDQLIPTRKIRNSNPVIGKFNFPSTGQRVLKRHLNVTVTLNVI